jgi:hypothetical protein
MEKVPDLAAFNGLCEGGQNLFVSVALFMVTMLLFSLLAKQFLKFK